MPTDTGDALTNNRRPAQRSIWDVTADLFQGVIWPAVAGNVAWAFFTRWLDPKLDVPAAPALWTLALTAAYLFAEWVQTEMIRKQLKSNWYLILELLIRSPTVCQPEESVLP